MKSSQQCLLLVLIVFTIYGHSAGQWTKLNGPYGGTTASCFTSYGNILYTGSTLEGVFISADSGLNWQSIGNDELNYDGVLSLLRIDTILFAGTYYGLYKTTDNGLNWNKVKTGIPANRSVYKLALFDSIIFAGTDYAGIYRSSDLGKTWIQLHSSPPDWETIGFVSLGGKYIAGVNCEGLYNSADSGKTWEPLDSGIPPCSIKSLVVHNNMIFCGSLFFSSDSGKSWNKSENWIGETIKNFATTGSYLFALTEGHSIFRSADNGKSWIPVNNSLRDLIIYRLYVFGLKLFASTDKGVFQSSDFGSSWEMVDLRFTNTSINSMIFIDEELYAGTNDGIFKSSDKGLTWKTMNKGLDTYKITSFLQKGSDLFAGTPHGLYYFINSGTIWKYMDLDTTEVDITSLAKNSITIYAAGKKNIVYTSTDNGKSWNTITLPDSVYPVFRPGIRCIAADNSNLFIGTYLYGVYRFNLETQTLTQINAGLTHPMINCLLTDGTNLYTGIREGVFISTDYGTSWQVSNKGIPIIWGQLAAISLTSIDNALIAGIAHTVAISWNNGADWKGWTPYYDNFPHGVSVKSVWYRDSTIYMGTLSNGLWSYKIPAETTGIENDPFPEISQYSLNQNYPNPFNPKTVISWQLPVNSHVNLSIYNILGQKVSVLVDNFKPAGSYNVTFNGSDLASGLYFYRIQAGDFVQIKRMLLIK